MVACTLNIVAMSCANLEAGLTRKVVVAFFLLSALVIGVGFIYALCFVNLCTFHGDAMIGPPACLSGV